MSSTPIDPNLFNFGTWMGFGPAMAKLDLEFEKFRYLSLFDYDANTRNVVDASNYTVTPGSTVIILKESYLETFDDGTYEFTARFTDGNAKIGLTVDRSSGVGAPQDEDYEQQENDDEPFDCTCGELDCECESPDSDDEYYDGDEEQYDDENYDEDEEEYYDEDDEYYDEDYAPRYKQVVSQISENRRKIIPIALFLICTLIIAGTKRFRKHSKD